jgi:hypothetical protein
LEELLPKDNENIPFLGPVEPSEPQGFSPDQMIRCEECLRANPPTRLRKPVLRPPEKHQLGYNNILLPQDQAVSADVMADAATLLKLSEETLQEILSHALPLPVARTASREEAELVDERLRDLGLRSLMLSDHDLGLSDNAVKRVKSMIFEDEYLVIQQSGAAEEIIVQWADIVLILPARVFETRFEMTERITRKPEKEIVDTSEFFRDEAVIDFYTSANASTWRVSANGFDFSCLGDEKALVANENIGRLQRLIAVKAANAEVDDSYRRVRNVLEFAWAMPPETQSSGWRRERPGKLSVGMATTKSNETQFTRYSRLRFFIHR